MKKKIFAFQIPDLPPSVNSIYKMSKGRIYKDDYVHVFERFVFYTVKRPAVPFDYPIGLSLSFIFSDKRKYEMSDIDNLLKVTLDTLEKGLIIRNDNLIVELQVAKRKGPKDATTGFLFDVEEGQGSYFLAK